ncbi:MAG: 50S ribosomal protein L18Ae [Promethearchaeota archaeon]
MSDVKVFRIEGEYVRNHEKYIFRKEKRAIKQEDALELVLSEISSIGLYRRQIKITNIKELKEEEITNPLILQMIHKQQ